MIPILIGAVQTILSTPTSGQVNKVKNHETEMSPCLTGSPGYDVGKMVEEADAGIDCLETVPPEEAETVRVSEDYQAGFRNAIESAFPMTPGMIHEYRDAYRANESAILEKVEPRPVVDSKLVWLEPGSDVPIIHLYPGIASVLGFYDESGAPWPVRQYVIGDGDNYEVVQLGENSNSLAVAPKSRVGWSNLVVALLDEWSPVVIRLRIGDQNAHFRSAIQVMKSGPNSESVLLHEPERIRAGDAQLLSALIGYDLPSDATRISVIGAEVEAWLLDDEILLRTRLPLLSPAWSSHLSAPNGIRAYRLKLHSHLLLAAGDRIVRADIELP